MGPDKERSHKSTDAGICIWDSNADCNSGKRGTSAWEMKNCFTWGARKLLGIAIDHSQLLNAGRLENAYWITFMKQKYCFLFSCYDCVYCSCSILQRIFLYPLLLQQQGEVIFFFNCCESHWKYSFKVTEIVHTNECNLANNYSRKIWKQCKKIWNVSF